MNARRRQRASSEEDGSHLLESHPKHRAIARRDQARQLLESQAQILDILEVSPTWAEDQSADKPPRRKRVPPSDLNVNAPPQRTHDKEPRRSSSARRHRDAGLA